MVLDSLWVVSKELCFGGQNLIILGVTPLKLNVIHLVGCFLKLFKVTLVFD